MHRVLCWARICCPWTRLGCNVEPETLLRTRGSLLLPVQPKIATTDTQHKGCHWCPNTSPVGKLGRSFAMQVLMFRHCMEYTVDAMANWWPSVLDMACTRHRRATAVTRCKMLHKTDSLEHSAHIRCFPWMLQKNHSDNQYRQDSPVARSIDSHHTAHTPAVHPIGFQLHTAHRPSCLLLRQTLENRSGTTLPKFPPERNRGERDNSRSCCHLE